jgi:hypothetical protein
VAVKSCQKNVRERFRRVQRITNAAAFMSMDFTYDLMRFHLCDANQRVANILRHKAGKRPFFPAIASETARAGIYPKK